MCGIAGVVRREAGRETITRDLDLMRPGIVTRGPDGAGRLVEPEVGLLHTRLAIIDLVTGDQPIWNEARTVACVFNGEIYNFRSLRSELAARGHVLATSSDTEVLVHLYEERGPDLVSRLHGMYAFAIWDAEQRRVILARDRLGIKPLYLANVMGGIAFASSISSLVALPDVSRNPDAVALTRYLRTYRVTEPRTAYRSVRALLPGHTLVIDVAEGRQTERVALELPSAPPIQVSDVADRTADARSAFERSVDSHLVADVEIGAFLSGGIDSTLVVAQAQRMSSKPLRTFSVAFRGNPAYDESSHAERVARSLGTRHETFDVGSAPPELVRAGIRAAGQPFAVASFLPLLLLCERAAREVKVVLTGDGGDEIGGGYPWYRWMRGVPRSLRGVRAVGRIVDPVRGAEVFAGQFSKLRPLRRGLKFARGALLDRAAASDAWRYELTHEEALTLLSAEVRDEAKGAVADDDGWDATSDDVEAMRRFDLRVLLRDEMLPKLDRAGMAFGLEGRVPLLDDGLVDAMLRVPVRSHLAAPGGKALLKSWAKELCPVVDTVRSKHGFDVPIHAWLDGELRDDVNRLLLAPRSTDLFDSHSAQALIDRMRRGVPGAGHSLYAMLVAALWLETARC